MARIRTIKPEFWKSESIASLPIRARLTFIGLWTYVDDNGVGVDNHKLVDAELFGLEDDPRESRANVREDLARLHEAGRIVRYTVDGKRFLSIVNWSEHQKIDRPGKARHFDPSNPSATLLTCEEAVSLDLGKDSQAENSRESRESLARSHLPEQGTGSREQGTGEQGIPPTAGADEPRPDADDDPSESEGQRANRLARLYTDVVRLSNFPAVAGVVRKAIRAGLPDEEIARGLKALAEDARAVTADSLRYAIEGVPPSQFANGRPGSSVVARSNPGRTSTGSQRMQQGLAVAADLDARYGGTR